MLGGCCTIFMPSESDFKKREAEIEKARVEILALQERIKKLVTRRHDQPAPTKSLATPKRTDK
jgi:hypothetical protein